jgi:DNA-directed RNA polymerase subunit RPC12/RpoP
VAKSVCVDCGEEFVWYKDKPGRINQCTECGQEVEVERLGGNMIYLHKTGGYIEIKPLSEAEEFADKTRRLGAGVTASLTQSKRMAERQLFNHGQWMKDDKFKA